MERRYHSSGVDAHLFLPPASRALATSPLVVGARSIAPKRIIAVRVMLTMLSRSAPMALISYAKVSPDRITGPLARKSAGYRRINCLQQTDCLPRATCPRCLSI